MMHIDETPVKTHVPGLVSPDEITTAIKVGPRGRDGKSDKLQGSKHFGEKDCCPLSRHTIAHDY